MAFRRIGAHVSVSGGLHLAPQRAFKLGANTMQIFSGSPRGWHRRFPSLQSIKVFKKEVKRYHIHPVFIHSLYLINLGSQNPTLLKNSVEALIYDLRLAAAIGARGTIFHLGSHLGRGFKTVAPQVAQLLSQVLQKTKVGWLIIEHSARAGGKLGSRFEELRFFLQKLNNPRLKVCLDSCHLFVSGYGLKTRASLNRTLQKFNRLIGLKNLVCFHLNDAAAPFNSGIDRHQNIGQGYIGLDGFRQILNHPQLKHLPFIIETPGFEKSGPDKENIDRLKGLVV